MAIKPEVATGD